MNARSILAATLVFFCTLLPAHAEQVQVAVALMKYLKESKAKAIIRGYGYN